MALRGRRASRRGARRGGSSGLRGVSAAPDPPVVPGTLNLAALKLVVARHRAKALLAPAPGTDGEWLRAAEERRERRRRHGAGIAREPDAPAEERKAGRSEPLAATTRPPPPPLPEAPAAAAPGARASSVLPRKILARATAQAQEVAAAMGSYQERRSDAVGGGLVALAAAASGATGLVPELPPGWSGFRVDGAGAEEEIAALERLLRGAFQGRDAITASPMLLGALGAAATRVLAGKAPGLRVRYSTPRARASAAALVASYAGGGAPLSQGAPSSAEAAALAVLVVGSAFADDAQAAASDLDVCRVAAEVAYLIAPAADGEELEYGAESAVGTATAVGTAEQPLLPGGAVPQHKQARGVMSCVAPLPLDELDARILAVGALEDAPVSLASPSKCR